MLPKIVGPPRFELRMTEPKSVVLPLHYGPIKKSFKRYMVEAKSDCVLLSMIATLND